MKLKQLYFNNMDDILLILFVIGLHEQTLNYLEYFNFFIIISSFIYLIMLKNPKLKFYYLTKKQPNYSYL